MVSWTVSTENDAAMTAYIAMRLAQDEVIVTLDQALAEMLMISGMNQAATRSGPTIKNHGNKFF